MHGILLICMIDWNGKECFHYKKWITIYAEYVEEKLHGMYQLKNVIVVVEVFAGYARQ